MTANLEKRRPFPSETAKTFQGPLTWPRRLGLSDTKRRAATSGRGTKHGSAQPVLQPQRWAVWGEQRRNLFVMECSARRLIPGQEWELEMQGTNHEKEWSCGKL